jgi:hypothetical protein
VAAGRRGKLIAAKYRRLLAGSQNGPKIVEVCIDMANLPVTSTGWQGRNAAADPQLYSKDHLVDEQQFEYINWDGMWVVVFWLLIILFTCFNNSSNPCGILDKEDRAFIILVGRPDEKGFLQHSIRVAKQIKKAFKKVKKSEGVPKKGLTHRRGNYLSKSFGFSHGIGRSVSI